MPPSRIEVRRPSLEDVFVSIVEGGAALAADDTSRLRAALRTAAEGVRWAMKKIFYVASREFTSTVMTKGFILGMLITPLILGLVVVVFPRMIDRKPPRIEGQIAVIDPTGQVSDGIRDYLRPDQFAERAGREKRKVTEAMPQALKAAAASPEAQAAMKRSLDAAVGDAPRLDVVVLDPSVGLEDARLS